MIPRTILDQLAKLRLRERCLQLILGAAIVLAVVLGAFLLACTLDWVMDRFFETPAVVRWGLVIGQIALWTFAVAVLVIRPLRRRLTDSYLALYVEGKVRTLGHRLISAVQLNQPDARTRGMSPVLIAAVTQQAEEQVAQIRCAGLADHGRLIWSTVVVLGSLFIFAFVAALALVALPHRTVNVLINRQLQPWRSVDPPEYKFTEQSLAGLKKDEVPDDVLTKLKPLVKDEGFSEESLQKKLAELLSPKDHEAIQDRLLKRTANSERNGWFSLVEIPRNIKLVALEHPPLYPNDEQVQLEFKVKGKFYDGQTGTLRALPIGSGRADTVTLKMKDRTGDNEAIFVATVNGRSSDFAYTAYLGDGRTKEPSEVHYAARPAFLEEKAVVELPEYYGRRPDGSRYELSFPHGEISDVLVGSLAKVEVWTQNPVDRGEIDLLASDSASPDETPLATIKMNEIGTGLGLKLTDASFDALEKADMPKEVSSKLTGNWGIEVKPAGKGQEPEAELRKKANRVLEAVLADVLTKEELAGYKDLIFKHIEQYEFHYAAGRFVIDAKTKRYRVRVADEHGFTNEKPKPRTIHTIADPPPQVSLLEEQFGGATMKDFFTGRPIVLGGDVRIAYRTTSLYGLGEARFKYRVYRGEENKAGGENKNPVEWQTYPLGLVKNGSDFDPSTGAFNDSSFQDQVQFYLIPSVQPWRVPDGKDGGGRWDFHTKTLKLPDGKELGSGDFLEYFLEVSNRAEGENRKWGQSSVRIKPFGDAKAVSDWARGATNEEERLKKIKLGQGDLFGRPKEDTKPVVAVAPKPGAGRAIVAGEIKAQFKYNQNEPKGGQTNIEVRLLNTSQKSIPLGDLKIKYWFAFDDQKERKFDHYHSCARGAQGDGYYHDLGPLTSFGTPKDGKRSPTAQQYVEFGYNAASGVIPPGGTAELHGSLHSPDWSQLSFAGDYSWQPQPKNNNDYIDAPKVTVYQGDKIVWGVEPSGLGVFLPKAGEEDRKFGRSWRLIGPFANPTEVDEKGKVVKWLGRDIAYPPEVEKPVNLTKEYDGLNGKVRWQLQNFFGSKIGLDNFFKHPRAGVAYAVCWVHTKQKKAILATGSDDGIKVWINRKLVLDKATTRYAEPNQDRTPIELEDSWNEVLVKVDNRDLDWAFFLDLLDPDTKAPIDDRDIIVRTDGPDERPSNFVRFWSILGPFPNGGNLDEPLPPETDKVDPKKEYHVLNGNARWKTHISQGGRIELDSALNVPAGQPAVGYAACWVRCDKQRPAVIAGNSDGGAKVFLNGKAILSQPSKREGDAVAFEKPCELAAGWNEIMVKVDRKAGPLGFSLELRNPATGKPIEDVDFRTTSPDSDTRYVRSWLVLGPFPNKGHNEGYDTEYLPERDNKTKVDVAGEYDGLNGKVKWKPYKSDLERVDLRKAFGVGGDNPGIGYATCWIRSNNQQDALLAIGTDAGYKVWVNGKQEMSKNAQREAKPGEDSKRVRLNQGWNEIVLKVGSSPTGRWTYYCEVRNPNTGNEVRPLDNIEIRSTRPEDVKKPDEPKKKPDEPKKKPDEPKKKPDEPKKPDQSKKPEGVKKPDDAKKPDAAKKPEDVKKQADAMAGNDDRTRLRSWQILGPFRCSNNYQEFNEHMPPEQDKFDPNKEYKGANGPLRWKLYNGVKDVLTAKDVMGEEGQGLVMGYAVCWIHSDKAQRAVLLLGNDSGLKMVFNGKEIVNNRSNRQVKVGDDSRDVELKQGWNTVLVKMGTNNKEHPWTFGAQLLRPDRKGPVEGVEIRATPP